MLTFSLVMHLRRMDGLADSEDLEQTSVCSRSALFPHTNLSQYLELF